MLKIRLTRTGRKNAPSYRVVIANQRSKRDGEFLDYVGIYNPTVKPVTLEFKKDLVKSWMDKGAQPTATVKGLMVRAGLLSKPKKGELKVYKEAPGKKAVARVKKEKPE